MNCVIFANKRGIKGRWKKCGIMEEEKKVDIHFVNSNPEGNFNFFPVFYTWEKGVLKMPVFLNRVDCKWKLLEMDSVRMWSEALMVSYYAVFVASMIERSGLELAVVVLNNYWTRLSIQLDSPEDVKEACFKMIGIIIDPEDCAYKLLPQFPSLFPVPKIGYAIRKDKDNNGYVVEKVAEESMNDSWKLFRDEMSTLIIAKVDIHHTDEAFGKLSIYGEEKTEGGSLEDAEFNSPDWDEMKVFMHFKDTAAYKWEEYFYYLLGTSVARDKLQYLWAFGSVWATLPRPILSLQPKPRIIRKKPRLLKTKETKVVTKKRPLLGKRQIAEGKDLRHIEKKPSALVIKLGAFNSISNVLEIIKTKMREFEVRLDIVSDSYKMFFDKKDLVFTEELQKKANETLNRYLDKVRSIGEELSELEFSKNLLVIGNNLSILKDHIAKYIIKKGYTPESLKEFKENHLAIKNLESDIWATSKVFTETNRKILNAYARINFIKGRFAYLVYERLRALRGKTIRKNLETSRVAQILANQKEDENLKNLERLREEGLKRLGASKIKEEKVEAELKDIIESSNLEPVITEGLLLLNAYKPVEVNDKEEQKDSQEDIFNKKVEFLVSELFKRTNTLGHFSQYDFVRFIYEMGNDLGIIETDINKLIAILISNETIKNIISPILKKFEEPMNELLSENDTPDNMELIFKSPKEYEIVLERSLSGVKLEEKTKLLIEQLVKKHATYISDFEARAGKNGDIIKIKEITVRPLDAEFLEQIVLELVNLFEDIAGYYAATSRDYYDMKVFVYPPKGDVSKADLPMGAYVFSASFPDDNTRKLTIFKRSIERSLREVTGSGKIYGSDLKMNDLTNHKLVIGQIQISQKKPPDQVAFFSPYKRKKRSERSLIEYSPVVQSGACLYECYLLCVIKEKAHYCSQWPNMVMDSLSKESCLYFLSVEGNVKTFLYHIYLSNKICLGFYSCQTEELWSPGPNPLYRLLVISRGHAHVTNISKLAVYLKSRGFKGENFEELKESLMKKSTMSKVKQLTDNNNKYNLFRIQPCLKEAKENKKEPIIHHHYALDIETYPVSNGEQRPYLICVTTIPDSEEEEIESFSFYGVDCVPKFFSEFFIDLFIEAKKKTSNVHHFWTFNGSGFDFRLLIAPLRSVFNADLVGDACNLKSIKLGKLIEFLDLALWTCPPSEIVNGKVLKGLDLLAYKCKCSNRKLDFNHEESTLENINKDSFKLKAIEYCTMDCKVLGDLVRKFAIEMYYKGIFNGKSCYKSKAFFPHSSASLALEVFKNCFVNVLLRGSWKTYPIEKESYRGGMTLATKSYAENITIFDISSSYPYCMLKDMPVEIGIFCNSKDLPSPSLICPYNLYRVQSFEFPKDCLLPNISIRHETGSLIQVLKYKGPDLYLWGCEIKQALEQKAIIGTDGYYTYTGAQVFTDYVKYFYKLKSESKETHMTLFYKILLNSLYGKFGEKVHVDKAFGSFDDIKKTLTQTSAGEIEKLEVRDVGYYVATLGGKKDSGLNNVGSLVRIASYITALARTNLLEAAYSVGIENVCYMDTDSLFVIDNKQLSSKFLGSELGKFKSEGHYEAGSFFGAKNYVLFNKEGETLIPKVTKCKGVSKMLGKGNFITSFIKDLIKEGATTVTMTPVFVKKYDRVYVQSVTKTIRATIGLKRQIVSGSIETRPFETIADYFSNYTDLTNLTDIKKVGRMTKEESEKRSILKNKMVKALTVQNNDVSPLEFTRDEILEGVKDFFNRIKRLDPDIDKNIKEAYELMTKSASTLSLEKRAQDKPKSF